MTALFVLSSVLRSLVWSETERVRSVIPLVFSLASRSFVRKGEGIISSATLLLVFSLTLKGLERSEGML